PCPASCSASIDCTRGLAFAAWNLAQRPTLLFVGLNDIDDRCELGFCGGALYATLKLVGSVHQQCMHRVSEVGKMCHRHRRARPYSLLVAIAEFLHRLDCRRRPIAS